MSSGPELKGENTPTGPTWKSLNSGRKMDQQGMREQERGRDRTSQSKFSWSPTITSLAFPLPSFVSYTLCSPVSCSNGSPPSILQFSCPLILIFFFFLLIFTDAEPIRAVDQSGLFLLEVLQPVRVELTSSGISRVLECVSSKNESFLRPSMDWRRCRGNRKGVQSEFRQRESSLPESTREVWPLYFHRDWQRFCPQIT